MCFRPPCTLEYVPLHLVTAKMQWSFCKPFSIRQHSQEEIYWERTPLKCFIAKCWSWGKTSLQHLWSLQSCKDKRYFHFVIIHCNIYSVIFATMLSLSVVCTAINLIKKKLEGILLKKGQEQNSREHLDVEKIEEKRPRKSMSAKFLSCFLVHENARIIFSTYLAPSSLPVIHGVRSISLSWIIMAHLFVYTVSNIGNLPRVLTFTGDWYMQPFNSAAIAVDTFYVLG